MSIEQVDHVCLAAQSSVPVVDAGSPASDTYRHVTSVMRSLRELWKLPQKTRRRTLSRGYWSLNLLIRLQSVVCGSGHSSAVPVPHYPFFIPDTVDHIYDEASSCATLDSLNSLMSGGKRSLPGESQEPLAASPFCREALSVSLSIGGEVRLGDLRRACVWMCIGVYMDVYRCVYVLKSRRSA